MAINMESGQTMMGEIVNDNFVVQNGPDFDATFDVYKVGEEVAVIPDNDDCPMELDCEFADTPENRTTIAEGIEREELLTLLTQVIPAIEKNNETVVRLMNAVDGVLNDVRGIYHDNAY